MAQQAQQRERTALTIAPRYQKPPGFSGSDVAWRSLCDTYPSAETPDVLMALMEYCAVRKLDPFKRPCHVVPMWNSRLRRRVQVIMQGINEIEITAHRTGKWAGMDEPRWGPPVERKFRGEVEDDSGPKRSVEIALRFPEWCAVTVYRTVGSERRPFTEPVFWEEAYGRSGFRSEVPNARWQQAPRQMLHKCAKAASLRAAFPEEAGDYVREEMEDREIDAGGVVIDGKAEAAPPSQEAIERERQADETYGTDTGSSLKLHLLDEPNGTKWLRHLQGLLDAAETEDEVHQIAGHKSVRDALSPDGKMTPLIRENITDMLAKAFERVRKLQPRRTFDGDPVGALLEEIESMDATSLSGLASNAAWQAKVRKAVDFPPDEERITDAIEARKAALKQGGQYR